MYLVAYYIVFLRNESTMVKGKTYSDNVLLFSNAMHDLSICFDHHVVRLTYIDINMDIVNLNMSTVRTIRWHYRLQSQSTKQEVVGSSPAVGKNFSFCNSRFLCMAHNSNQSIQMKSTITLT